MQRTEVLKADVAVRFRDVSDEDHVHHDIGSDDLEFKYARREDHERDFWGALSAQQEAQSQNDLMSQYETLSQHGGDDALQREDMQNDAMSQYGASDVHSYGQKSARITRANTARRLFAGNDEENEYSDRRGMDVEEHFGGSPDDMSISYGRDMPGASGMLVCMCVF